MKSSLDLCPRDLHIVFGKNRAWQWQCLWPEWRLSLVRPVVTQSYICDFISPYITERMRFSRPILVFSAVFDKTGRSCSNSLPFFDAFSGWIYGQSFCHIDHNEIRLHFFDLPGPSGFHCTFSGSDDLGLTRPKNSKFLVSISLTRIIFDFSLLSFLKATAHAWTGPCSFIECSVSPITR